MSCINISDILVLNNPSNFTTPFQFEITFECVSPIQDDLEWSLTYVGSAETTEFDQVLETISLGPIHLGVSKFVFQANAPDISKIPPQDVFGVTVLLLTCSYKGNVFVRVGYYVNTEYTEPLEPPPPVLTVDNIMRKVVADQPRVTHFSIPWDNPEPEPEPSSQEIEGDIDMSDGDGGDEDEDDEDDDDEDGDESLSSDGDSLEDDEDEDEDMGGRALPGPFNFS